MSPETTDLEAFGALLLDRRIELGRLAGLGSAYSNRRIFAENRGIPEHISYRVEKGKNKRPEEATKVVIEQAYGLVQGSFDRSVASGRLELTDVHDDPPSALAHNEAPAESPDMAYLKAALPQLEPAHLSVLVGLIRSWIEPITVVPDHRHTA